MAMQGKVPPGCVMVFSRRGTEQYCCCSSLERGDVIMVIHLFDRLNFMQKLQFIIRHEYEPESASIEELAENVLDCYDSVCEEQDRRFLYVDGNKLDDIICFVNDSGGFELFDFVV